MAAYRSFATAQRFQSLLHLIRTRPARQLWPLWFAVFSTFAALGFELDILTRGRQPGLLLTLNVIACGTLATLYLLASIPARRTLFIATLGAHALYSAIVPLTFTLLPATPTGRLALDAVATMATVIVGYSMFLRFINMTAARYLRAEAEIAVAREIHHGLVPAIDGRLGGYQFHGWSLASGDVGGDLVDLVEHEGHWIGYVADVAGHGVGPGVVMSMFKSALRMRMRASGSIGELLADVQAVLMPLKPSATFVTVACVRALDADRVECAVAGHPPIMRVRCGVVDDVTEPQFAVGMFAGATFSSCVVDAAPGDLFVLLTDGLVEVFDRDNRELGFEWARRVLASAGDAPLSTIGERLLTGARNHGTQIDDQSLLLIRRDRG